LKPAYDLAFSNRGSGAAAKFGGVGYRFDRAALGSQFGTFRRE
jgi:hypothetical protein